MEDNLKFVGFEVLVVLVTKSSVMWDVTLHSEVKVNWLTFQRNITANTAYHLQKTRVYVERGPCKPTVGSHWL
jgi:hypothetical protein